MKRLVSTKNIFEARVSTTSNLLRRTEAQLLQEDRKLNVIHGAILRSSREGTLKKLQSELALAASEIGFYPPKSRDRLILLEKIDAYKKENAFLKHAAISQAVINLCVIYEDLIRRIILKFYEEDIRRLKSEKETLKNFELVEAILRGDNVHRTMAEKVVDHLMHAGFETWHKALLDMGFNRKHNALQELFLVRHCLVHNDGKVSPKLSHVMPSRYVLRKPILLSVSDFAGYKDAVRRDAKFLMKEYSRLFPINRGTWHKLPTARR